MGRKAKAASSAKALEVCGDTSRLGVSAADVFAQFNAPINSYSEEPQSVALDDVEAGRLGEVTAGCVFGFAGLAEKGSYHTAAQRARTAPAAVHTVHPEVNRHLRVDP
ncbi:unnamed protein product [Cladocopium goreaui]|uniref:Uncharacterized protein n=1 Tax=Cladocopium goreaui TaxID=2562237 RepID=A0A9P1CHK8_9DINO|nr:unnamed protein product [Cladocopium goreaui]